jgi:hypothetical protein
MGDINNPKPALLLFAVSSRYDEALAWAQQRASEQFGPLQAQSPTFEFVETDSYQTTMGTNLKKQFLTFQNLIDPGSLPEIKRWTNEWELQYARENSYFEPRPLNLDPGYLTLAKLVLASTKDHAHRIYLQDGIYAEVTLNYRHGGWEPSDWTFPDYRRQDYQEFFSRCRQYLRPTAN